MSVLEELDQSTELINEKKDEGNQSLEELAQATNKVTESSKEIAEIITQTDNSADKISSASGYDPVDLRPDQPACAQRCH